MHDLLLLAADAPAVVKPALALDLRLSLSAMHFLEFAAWGAWWVVLGQYLHALGFSRKAIAAVYATMPIGATLSPLFVGMIADKYLDSKHIMIVSQAIGTALLFALAYIRTPASFFCVSLLYALVFSPTLSLVNSIVFASVPDGQRDFPTIRVLGTIGWILANLMLKVLLPKGQPVNNRPILLAGVFSAMLTVVSFLLPSVPPSGADFPLGKAVALLGDPSHAVFYFVSFVITIALAFYFSFASLFLEQEVKIDPENVGPLTTIGQAVEIFFMFSLSYFITWLGMKNVLAIGMAAWAVRYACFSFTRQMAFMILAIGLHGICFDFFLAAGFIHAANTAPEGIATTCQSMFAMLTYGLGMCLGTFLAGWLNDSLTTTEVREGREVRVTNWSKFWSVPMIGAAVSLGAFLLLFQTKEPAPAPAPSADPPSADAPSEPGSDAPSADAPSEPSADAPAE